MPHTDAIAIALTFVDIYEFLLILEIRATNTIKSPEIGSPPRKENSRESYLLNLRHITPQ